MFKIGMTYNVVSTRGVYVVTIRAQSDKDIDLLNRISEIAKIEEIKPMVKFAYH